MALPALTDPTATPNYAPTAFQQWLERRLYEPRDAVFLRLTLKVVLVMGPLIALLYWHFSWWLAAAFAAVQLPLLAPPVILMLHNTMHRPFLKGPKWVNRAHGYLMSALFGIPTGYMEHHVGMHHAENNLSADLSSTMRYQRDHFGHFLIYLFRFLFLIHVELTSYLRSKHRVPMAWRAMLSDLVHMGAMAGLLVVAWRPTLVAFVIPYVAVRFMMMMGNWGQHAFIDPARPGDSYVNSITCINSGYNARCFNDGYHIGHHVKQNRHWSEMPQDFVGATQRYRDAGCIVFTGLDFFMVSALLFLHRYDVLARRFVRLEDDTRSDEEVVQLLRARTRRIASELPEGAVLNA